ncbi:MAG: MFS transporter [Akkermansia sp.]
MSLPSQSKFIIGNEACERFSFYGMRSILMLYMLNELRLSEDLGVGISHLFIACIYILPIFGAWLADQLLGRYKCILYISLFYCLGHGTLALTDLASSIEMQRILFFAGLTLIAVGAGGIKPCVSAFVGDQMKGQSKEAMTRMYAAFYWSINLGSFFAMILIPVIRYNWGYSWAFGIPGIFMAIATLVFYLGRRQYLHTEPAQPQFAPALLCRMRHGITTASERFGRDTMSKSAATLKGIFKAAILIPVLAGLAYGCYAAGSAIATSLGGSDNAVKITALLALLIYLVTLLLIALKLASKSVNKGFFSIAGCMLFDKNKFATDYQEVDKKEARNMIRVLIVFLMIIPFWSLFEQTMSSWVIQGEKMTAITPDLSFLPWHFEFRLGAEEMQSFNPLLVMLLIPSMTLFFYPYIGKWSTPLRRMGLGIVLAGISYMSVAYLQRVLDGGTELSILWQGIPYILLTVSEILVSTTGLEYAYVAAGKRLKSTVISFWYLASTAGNLLIVVLSSLVSDPASVSTFLLYGFMSIIVGLIFIYVTTRPKFQAEEIPEDELETA